MEPRRTRLSGSEFTAPTTLKIFLCHFWALGIVGAETKLGPGFLGLMAYEERALLLSLGLRARALARSSSSSIGLDFGVSMVINTLLWGRFRKTPRKLFRNRHLSNFLRKLSGSFGNVLLPMTSINHGRESEVWVASWLLICCSFICRQRQRHPTEIERKRLIFDANYAPVISLNID